MISLVAYICPAYWESRRICRSERLGYRSRAASENNHGLRRAACFQQI